MRGRIGECLWDKEKGAVGSVERMLDIFGKAFYNTNGIVFPNIRNEERKPMKKKLARVAVVAGITTLMMVGFAGCKKTECDFCGEEKRCSTEEFFGQEMNICKDCEEDMEDIGKMLK